MYQLENCISIVRQSFVLSVSLEFPKNRLLEGLGSRHNPVSGQISDGNFRGRRHGFPYTILVVIKSYTRGRRISPRRCRKYSVM